MSSNAEIALVAQAVLQRHTYYFANRAGITLDGTSYDNTMISVSDGAYEGNFGEGFNVGSINVVIVNGETFIDNKYKYQITDIWNNKEFTIKRWESGDTTWAGCDYYYKGLIKGFDYQFGKISFSVDNKDSRDDILLPSIKCEDNSGLSDAEAQSPFAIGGNQNGVYASNTNIFSVGELILLTAPNGNTEYQKIIAFFGNLIVMGENLLHFADYSTSYINKIEKAFRNLPKAFIGKTLPIQIGDLSDAPNGEFGKTITINDKIGKQIILTDNFTINELNSIGAWDKGTKKYFTGIATGEYEIISTYKGVIFQVDSTTTLSSNIINTDDGVHNIFVTDYTQLLWVNEDDVEFGTPELLSVNIIAIDSELMQIITEPTSDEIWVDRGYNGTEITTHDAGAKIYQCAKYSAKNLLSFEERFDVVGLANQHYSMGGGQTLDMANFINSGKWANCYDGNTNTYIEFLSSQEPADNNWVYNLNFDIKFANIDSDFKVTATFIAAKVYINLASVDAQYNYLKHSFFNPNQETSYDDLSGFHNETKHTYFLVGYNEWNDTLIETFDTYSTVVKETSYSDPPGEPQYYLKPDLGDDSEFGDIHSLEWGTPFYLSTLKDLNKKWKCTIYIVNATDVIYRMYALGLWVDFFLDFTRQTVIASLKGREITSDVTVVNNDTSPSRIGDLCENPVDVLALLLLQEVGYETTDFDATWETVWEEYDTLASVCALSYGVDDDQKEGWKFCEWLASHFNLAITKLPDGTIDIINLYEIYNDTPAGDEILIEDDVLFLEESSEKLIVIKQTGTDLIYNDFIVKYARNNSTGEYQKEYHLPETYILENDMVPPINLLDARNRYYNGKKRTKIIESPFIYNEDDARRKAEWEANNHACVNLWVEVGIDYNNTDRIGDIKYFTGSHNGVVLSSDNKFFIQNIYPTDEGRELALHCKSIQGVDAIIDPDDDNVILDTGGTSLIGDDIWHDTGGTSLSGDDIIQDTGAGSSV